MAENKFDVGVPVENRSTLEVGEIRMPLKSNWFLVAVDQMDVDGTMLDVWHLSAMTKLIPEGCDDLPQV